MLDWQPKAPYTAEQLLEILRILRDPENGCPWDKVQTHRSIRMNFLEEAYEAVDAIDLDDPELLCEELGDVLMQVAFHAQIEREAGHFTFAEVCDGVCRKLLDRHPHIFRGDESIKDWDSLKNKEKGITGGIGNGLFGPNQPCTRAQIVTFLWRAAGSSEPKSMSSFSDVSADSYYAKAVAWAVENGITTGTGDGKFSPDATCTREQSVTFLFRAIGKLVDSKAEFSDVLTDSYYANAVAWAVENGVTNGIGDGLFGPDNSCTRAQIVTFLFRAYQGK